jgi:biotin operon repressor
MKPEELKRAILQHLLKHQGEWIHGKIFDALFGCNRRKHEKAIATLRFEKYPIIADKGKGFKISYDTNERREYWDACERELKARLASVKTMRAIQESGELFAQDFVIQREMDSL